jgi:predicted transcriptional regulator
MGAPLPVVDASESADVVTKLLAARNSAVLVRGSAGITGILTRFDMLQFIAGGE